MASLIQAVATYRPRVAKAHTVHLHEMAERLTRGSLVTRSIADMVLADLVDEIRLSLRAGNTVSLDGVGSFRPGIGLDGSVRIGVRLDPKLRRAISGIDQLDGTIFNRENIGLSTAKVIERWNAEHPDDPIVASALPTLPEPDEPSAASQTSDGPDLLAA